MYLTNKDKGFIAAVLALFLGIALAGWLEAGIVAVLIAVGLMAALAIAVQVESYRRMQRALHEQHESHYQNYRQIESLFSLFSLLKLNDPLPPMREWAVSPDFVTILIALIHERRPALIVEVGSGVTTLVAAYCLKEIGAGRVVSLDHKEQFASATTRALSKHGLSDIATVVYAPITEHAVQGKPWRWYDSTHLNFIEPIDLLVVDGPPGDVGDLARYPALPLLHERLSDNAVILLDDASRRDMRTILDLWLREFDNFDLEQIDTEKGAAILRKRRHVAERASAADPDPGHFERLESREVGRALERSSVPR